MTFDSSRFVYALAGKLIGVEWTREQIHAAALAALLEHRFRVPKLAERILTAFSSKPAFNLLAAFLCEDRSLIRAMSRASRPAIASVSSRPRSLSKPKPHPDERPIKLRGIAIPRLAGEADLFHWFGMTPGHLRWLADIGGRNRKHPAGPLRVYRYRWIPRPGRFPRLLEIPKLTLKQMQQKILADILSRVPIHPACHGFCAGRSIVTNAAPHCGKETILRFDLADFFPSISSARIFRICRTIGYPADVSRILMGLCTTQLPADVWDARPGGRDGADFAIRQHLIGRHLPQGAPTSPSLANLAAHRLDRRLSGLARTAGAVYTRYADDLTFSGGANLSRCRKRFGDHVALIAREEGFFLNFRKTRIQRAGVRQYVAGVVVNVRPNIPRDQFDRLKAILTNCTRYGPASQNRGNLPDFRAHLIGKIAHVASINLERGEKLARIFGRIIWM